MTLYSEPRNRKAHSYSISFFPTLITIAILVFFMHSTKAGEGEGENDNYKKDTNVIFTQPSGTHCISNAVIIIDQPTNQQKNSTNDPEEKICISLQKGRQIYADNKIKVECLELITLASCLGITFLRPNQLPGRLSQVATDCSLSTLLVQCCCDQCCISRRKDGKDDTCTETCIPCATSIITSTFLQPCGGGFFGCLYSAAFTGFISGAISELYVIGKEKTIPSVSAHCSILFNAKSDSESNKNTSDNPNSEEETSN